MDLEEGQAAAFPSTWEPLIFWPGPRPGPPAPWRTPTKMAHPGEDSRTWSPKEAFSTELGPRSWLRMGVSEVRWPGKMETNRRRQT